MFIGMNVVYKWDYQVEKKLVKASSSGGHIEMELVHLNWIIFYVLVIL